MAEFEEKSNGKEDVKIDTCEHGSKVRESVRGVTRSGNKWRARIYHPKLKIEISLGYHNNHEDAALAVKTAKAEFLEMFKDDSTNVNTCRDNFEGRRLPPGVSRRGYSRWGARMYHQGLKRNISLGCYNSPVEASIALNNKRDELSKIYGHRPNFKNGCKTDNLLEGPNSELIDDLRERASISELRVKVKRDCKFDDEVVEEPKREVVTKLGNREKLSGHLKVPRGVRKLKSGKWCARIAGPLGKTRIWLGTFDNAEEAVRSYNKGKAELAAKREKANSGSIKRCQTLILGSDNLNYISINDESNVGVSIADVSDKPEHTGAQRLPISVFESGQSDSLVGERSMISGCVSEFDEAMSLGIINEYGQLVGKYSKLDEEMDFSLPGEDIRDTGWYSRVL